MSYKGQPTFESVSNVKLRAFNRLAIFWNVTRDQGQDSGKDYLEHFDDIARAHVRSIMQEIKDRGYTTVYRELSSDAR